ncbi:MAG: Chlorophyll A-B binding protein [Phormidesmis priestleyi Ana]|uniref:Chlorophyll A-B binding protein n=1 Tax=Phormidesmis priestleyi Ana TaxID=1666911 RepID=A0A0P8C377_9CYAN|nr:MAG: Chlorophyll A-B binding protein [Phormidesmis priestleyi Ana]
MKDAPATSPTTNAPAKLGFTEFAETWNGRLAMIGFVAAIVTEMLSGKGILEQLGLM